MRKGKWGRDGKQCKVIPYLTGHCFTKDWRDIVWQVCLLGHTGYLWTEEQFLTSVDGSLEEVLSPCFSLASCLPLVHSASSESELPFTSGLHRLDPFGNQCRCVTNFSVAFYRGDLVAFDRNSSHTNLHITEYIRSRDKDGISSLSSSVSLIYFPLDGYNDCWQP